jgi:hypothetical protein
MHARSRRHTFHAHQSISGTHTSQTYTDASLDRRTDGRTQILTRARADTRHRDWVAHTRRQTQLVPCRPMRSLTGRQALAEAPFTPAVPAKHRSPYLRSRSHEKNASPRRLPQKPVRGKAGTIWPGQWAPSGHGEHSSPCNAPFQWHQERAKVLTRGYPRVLGTGGIKRRRSVTCPHATGGVAHLQLRYADPDPCSVR